MKEGWENKGRGPFDLSDISRFCCNSKNRSEHSAYIAMFHIRKRLTKGEKKKEGEEGIEEKKNL
jgi:hypothetical protein